MRKVCILLLLLSSVSSFALPFRCPPQLLHRQRTQHRFATQPTNSDNGPDKWNAETTPFEIIQYFKQDDVSDEDIRSFLQENSIQTIGDLYKNSDSLVFSRLCRFGTISNIVTALIVAMSKPKHTMESVLNGTVK